MDNKVIEVLDYMGEKLGIAIDWTSENVMPQVTEFMGRYKVYAIVENGIHVITLMIFAALIGVFLKIMFKGIATKDHNNIWYDMSWTTDGMIPVFITIILVVLAGFSIASAVDHVFNIARWALIPEIQFFETFSEYLKSAS
jgi:Zn-dependent M28 family amino/carboxypeptidase